MSIALAVMPFGCAFGIAASEAGLALWQTAGFSIFVFAGSAQFAAVEIIGDGGSAFAAIAAGLLLNVRSLAFGVVMAPSWQGPWWRRALWSQVLVDETTAISTAQRDLRWRRYAYVASGLILFTAWNVSTLVGAGVLSSAGDLVETWGLDATIPAAFLALLWPRLSDPGQRRSALVGAAIALAAVPITPAGVPILLGALGVAAGWSSASSSTREASTP